jgi:hypothetical protein
MTKPMDECGLIGRWRITGAFSEWEGFDEMDEVRGSGTCTTT